MTDELAERIDDLLPQTQCGACGYAGCRPYADAIAAYQTGINHCPPGGAAGVVALANLLGQAVLPLDPANGPERARTLAVIDEALCIGCTKCIQACPVDAIVGAAKRMHTVLVDECTGCELCVAVCPVDCIALIPAPQLALRPFHARARFRARNQRLERQALQRLAVLEARKAALQKPAVSQASVLAAIARGRARKQALQAASLASVDVGQAPGLDAPDIDPNA